MPIAFLFATKSISLPELKKNHIYGIVIFTKIFHYSVFVFYNPSL